MERDFPCGGGIEGKILEGREKSWMEEKKPSFGNWKLAQYSWMAAFWGKGGGGEMRHSGGPLGQIVKDSVGHRWGEGLRNVESHR